jgi:diguanylate cyclase (GGDEF)-like protein/PAS domain S-box-containing protein
VDDGVWSLAPTTLELLYLNPAAERLFGHSLTELRADPEFWQTLLRDDRPTAERTKMRQATESPQVERELQLDRPDGMSLWLRMRTREVRGSGNELLRLDGVVSDITEQKRALDAVTHRADHDSLTGLPNRRAFDDMLERTAGRAMRGQAGALLLLDLDHFKRINDTAGHPAGDEALRRVAALLQEQVRPNDFLARLGGDEFAVVLAETPLEVATTVAERLLQAVRGFSLDREGQIFKLGLCVGVAPIDGEPADTSVARADAALYQAKEMGRDRVVVSGAGARV